MRRAKSSDAQTPGLAHSSGDWFELPQTIRRHVEHALGSPVVAFRRPGSVYGSEFAGVLELADCRMVFAKASASQTLVADYQVEAAVAAALPRSVSSPRLRLSVSQGPWQLLCFDAIDGYHPNRPWTREDLTSVLASFGERAQHLDPVPTRLTDLRTIAQLIAPTNKFTVWRDLAKGEQRRVRLADLPIWVADRVEQLAALESEWESAASGRALLHFDPRSDNQLIDEDKRAWMIDWSRACLGGAWVDLVTFLPDVAADGHPVQQILWIIRWARTLPRTRSTPIWPLSPDTGWMWSVSPTPLHRGSTRVAQRQVR